MKLNNMILETPCVVSDQLRLLCPAMLLTQHSCPRPVKLAPFWHDKVSPLCTAEAMWAPWAQSQMEPSRIGRARHRCTEKLQDLEVGHIGLSELHIVETMSQRKNRMIELSDAFIALPGGFGTLEEFAETISLAVLNYHDKPTGLNLRGFYDHLFSFIEHAQIEGFIRHAKKRALCKPQPLTPFTKGYRRLRSRR